MNKLLISSKQKYEGSAVHCNFDDVMTLFQIWSVVSVCFFYGLYCGHTLGSQPWMYYVW